MLALSSLGAAVFRGPLILVMPDLGLHINLDQLESTSNTTFHASATSESSFFLAGDKETWENHMYYTFGTLEWQGCMGANTLIVQNFQNMAAC